LGLGDLGEQEKGHGWVHILGGRVLSLSLVKIGEEDGVRCGLWLSLVSVGP
jgi:hypothetical protein